MMMAIGGAVRGGIYGTAANLNPTPDNPTLENAGGDVTYETDFRSVYAKVLDGWMGTDSTAILGGNFRNKRAAHSLMLGGSARERIHASGPADHLPHDKTCRRPPRRPSASSRSFTAQLAGAEGR